MELRNKGRKRKTYIWFYVLVLFMKKVSASTYDGQ